jgi:hypothetical protein
MDTKFKSTSHITKQLSLIKAQVKKKKIHKIVENE